MKQIAITKAEQVEKRLPNWFLEMFAAFDVMRQVWWVRPIKEWSAKHTLND